VNIEPLEADRVGELEDLFRRIGLAMDPGNVRQFCLPRVLGPGHEVGALGLFDERRLVGAIGYLDVPARLKGFGPGPVSVRWPINIYLEKEHRGKGWGVRLMEATRQGARVRLVIGGNQASIPVLEKTGWRAIGTMTLFRWARPCLDPRRLGDRRAGGARRLPPDSVRLSRGAGAVEARRVDRLDGALPWVAVPPASPPDNGVVRDGSYLDFAFGGALRAHHSLHAVLVSGALAGYFVLAARAERWPVLTVEIVDLDAAAGRETQVIRAARKTALACADVVRLRVCGDRFVAAARRIGGAPVERPDLPLRISCDDDVFASLGDHGSWRLTYGDHDQYRIRPVSRAWVGGASQAAGPN